MWVNEVVDIDMDTITFVWTLSDGGSLVSKPREHINYTFATDGVKNLQVYADDGDDQSGVITQSVTLIKVPVDNGGGNGNGNGDGDVAGSSNDNSMLIIIIIIVVVLFLIIIAVLLFFVLRKKPAPPAQIYYDQQQLAAFQAQGLPPGTPGALPPGANPELPPAPQDYGQQPGAVPPAGMPPQMAVTPQVGEAAPQPEQPQGMACPSCGSPVDPTWFLCPNCKAPLQ
jgi:preprotein translocase subunit SecG